MLKCKQDRQWIFCFSLLGKASAVVLLNDRLVLFQSEMKEGRKGKNQRWL